MTDLIPSGGDSPNGWCDTGNHDFNARFEEYIQDDDFVITCVVDLVALQSNDPDKADGLMDAALIGVGHNCVDHGEVRSDLFGSQSVVVCDLCGGILQDVPVQGRR